MVPLRRRGTSLGWGRRPYVFGHPAWTVIFIVLFFLFLVYASYGILPSLILVSVYIVLLGFGVANYIRYREGSPRDAHEESRRPVLPLPPDEDYEPDPQCPNCRRYITMRGTRWCPGCGQRLPWTLDTQATRPSRLERPRSFEKGIPSGRRPTLCGVCKSVIAPSDEVVYCPHCGAKAHRLHMLEWIHVKGVCPVCSEDVNEKELVYRCGRSGRVSAR